MSKQRGSARIKGDLRFAESREAVDYTDPWEEADREDGLNALISAQEDLATARDALELAYTKGLTGAGLDRLERHVADLQARVTFLEAEVAESAEEDDGGFISLNAAVGSRAFLDYIFQAGAANLYEAFKNFLAVVRKVSPGYLDGMTQTQIAALLGETKAAVSAREIRMVEDLLRRWGAKGFLCLGGSKSLESREAFAKAAVGNTNRRGGGSAKKAAALAGARKPSVVSSLVTGTISNGTISEARKLHYVKVLRPSGDWETWAVRAVDGDGAIAVARDHFALSSRFELVSRPRPKKAEGTQAARVRKSRAVKTPKKGGPAR